MPGIDITSPKIVYFILAAAIIAGTAASVIFLVGDDNEVTEVASQVAEGRIILEEIVNKVETDRRRSPNLAGSFYPAIVGQSLIAGDGIKTYRYSEARVDIFLGDAIRITRTAPNTLWRLGKFGLKKGAIVELFEGKIFLIEEGTDVGTAPVKIITPAGTASPRGTWMSVEYDSESGLVELLCFDGECQLENEAGRQVVLAGHKSKATALSAPTPGEPMSQEEILEFANLPEASSGEVPFPNVDSILDPPQLALAPAAIVVPTLAPPASPALSSGLTISPKVVAEPASEPRATKEPEPENMASDLPVASESTPTPTPSATAVPTPDPTPVPISLPELVPEVLPKAFLGKPTLNGEPAPYGTLITAWMDRFSSPLAEGAVSEGSFLLIVPQYGAASFANETLRFKIGDLDAVETAKWESGGADLLNLTASDYIKAAPKLTPGSP